MDNLIRYSISGLWALKVIISASAGIMLLQSSATTIRVNSADITSIFSIVLFALSMLYLSVAYSSFKSYFKYTFITASVLGLLYLSFFIQQITLLTSGELPTLKNLYTHGFALFVCLATLTYSYVKNRSNIHA